MNLLLDTHTLLWWLSDDPALGDDARSAIAKELNTVMVSAASAWEISIKRALGKLDAPEDLPSALEMGDLHPLPITIHHAIAAGALPRHHDDPFDRMLVAQARLEGLTIVTRDEQLARYGVPLLAA